MARSDGVTGEVKTGASGLTDVVRELLGLGGNPDHELVIRELRLPRVLTAVLVGAAFGISGQIFQRMVHNPLASPDILGVSAGGAVGAVFCIVVIGAGGGGVPVAQDEGGTLRGIEAVIDKDLAAAVLGRSLGVDVLVIATDVDHVALDFGTPDQRPLGRPSVTELREHARAGHFASGSMGPKVEAACRFVEAGGRRTVITSLDRITGAVAGTAGTVVER